MRWQSRNRSVCFRSACTTGGPIVRLGTKWPSITSTWSRSASAATRSTSLPRQAKSAERIDGDNFTTSPYLAHPGSERVASARRFFASEREHEHAVGARGMREQQCTTAVRSPRRIRWRKRAERRKRASRPFVDVESLLASQRAHRIHEDAAVSHQRRGRVEQLALECRELVDRRLG